MSLLLLALLGLGPDPEDAGRAWRYVVPEAGATDEHPPFRAILLGAQKPEDLIENVAYRGKTRRYGQVRYGSSSSVRVAIVVDEVGSGEVDLYVDADRNRRIDGRDRVKGKDRTWRLPLDAAIVEGDALRFEHRAAVLRLGSSGKTIGFAAAGYLDGKVKVGDRAHAARRFDGDGNGSWTDAQDRLWIDLDDDGRWDAVEEQFLFTPILTIGGERYVARSDEQGRRLTLEPLQGTGTVRLDPKGPGKVLPVAEVAVTLLGRDGSAFGLRGAAEATLPAGEYRVGSLTIALDDPNGGPRWNFVFSDGLSTLERRWYTLGAGERLALDPIGALSMRLEVRGKDDRCTIGEPFSVRPALYTGDGLLIVTCYRGTAGVPGSDDGPGSLSTLETTDGRRLDSAREGFT